MVGCGISGLVVTNRLSEDPVTVLCIEAGDADHYEAIIQNPVYVGADVGSTYDWDLSTVPQTQLDGATRPMPQGKVLGVAVSSMPCVGTAVELMTTMHGNHWVILVGVGRGCCHTSSK